MSFSQRCNHANEIQTLYSQLVATGFDTKKPISYHYFFIDNDPQALVLFKELLLKQNYRFVNTSKKGDKYQLEVEKTEALNAESAMQVGKTLNQLAKANNIDIFDGFELKSEEKEESFADFKEEVEQIPVLELFKKGIELYDKKNDLKALIVFDRCIKLGINSEMSYYKRGNCKTSLGQITGAIDDLENTLRLNPKHYEASFNLGGLYFDGANYEKAATYYQKAILLNPRSDNGFYRLAATYQKMGMKNAALQNCQKSLQINPNNSYAKELIGSLK
ncbi:tetratricopeptide repeat protein [Emticicia sp. SJ17W-69]|uniref:tetratricopeptide repeat protein n=1 Tax=Emticicia sp. SJ17W-69 TaxID=3421657 RepID=UPI003EBB59EF